MWKQEIMDTKESFADAFSLPKGCNYKICICGNCLTIKYYTYEDMKISGQINEIKIIR